MIISGDRVHVMEPAPYITAVSDVLQPVSYTHLDVYKRQGPWWLDRCDDFKRGKNKIKEI